MAGTDIIKKLKIKHIVIITAVVIVFAAAGYLGVSIYASELRNGAAGAETEAPAYEPSVMGYNFGDAMNKAAIQIEVTGGTAPDVPDEETDAGVDVINLLYPLSGGLSKGYYSNFLQNMSDRYATPYDDATESDSITNGAMGNEGISTNAARNATPLNSGGRVPTVSTTENSIGEAHTDFEGGGMEPTGTEHADAEHASASSPVPENPVFPAPAGTFETEIISENSVGDVIVSGNVNLKNNSALIIEDAFFELSLNYGNAAAPDIKTRYAYVKNIGLAGGGVKKVSFAAAPLAGGGADYVLDGIALTAFSTHIGGEPKMIYYDTDNSFLEVLSADKY